MRFTPMLVIVVGCDAPPCSIEATVSTFVEEHGAVECGIPGQGSGAGPLPGAESVHDCILDAISDERAFVGGYKHYGVEGANRHVFLGSANELWYFYQSFEVDSSDGPLSRTSCTAIVDRPGDPSIDLGLECIDANLAEICDSPDRHPVAARFAP